jgi:PAS domain S-box-containing protein
MNSAAASGPPAREPIRSLEQELREMNDALLVSSVRQNELAEQAREAEGAMRDSERRYRRLFQSSKDGILILDALTGRIIDANAFISGLLGRELSELVDKELHEVGIFDDVATNAAAFQTLRDKGYLHYDNLLVRNRSGQTTPVEFVSNVYEDGQRQVAQCNVRDISVRAAMEKQIKDQALALADQDRRKDEFMAMLSHELRNPLAPIRTAIHLLRLQGGDIENPIQQHAREVIERQVGTLTRLVNDLMEVSRLVSGKIHLVTVTMDLRQAVRHALETVAPLMKHHGHELSIALAEGPVWVRADATRLEQVIVNLLNNAAKFTDTGGQITLSLDRRESEAVLSVRDSGVGIAPEMLTHVFDLFAQADRSLARTEGGLGIGLSLVQRLIQLHGGTVEAKSAGIGKGSEFIVRMPITPAPGALSSPTPPSPPDHEAKLLRVLVVDDNVDGCMLLAKVVRRNGYSVQTAFTGPAALATATVWRPDVVLLDIGLPEINGFEIARRLRADPATKATKLVAVTGYGSEKDIELGREAGFDAHLVKPVDLVEVEELLAAWNKQR